MRRRVMSVSVVVVVLAVVSQGQASRAGGGLAGVRSDAALGRVVVENARHNARIGPRQSEVRRKRARERVVVENARFDEDNARIGPRQSEVRRERAGASGRYIGIEDVIDILRSRNESSRRAVRARRAAADREEFEAGLAEVRSDAARGRVVADNARLEEDNARLREAIALAREARGRAIFVKAFRIALQIVLTVATGDPVTAAAVSGGVESRLNGGDLGDVVLAATVDGVTAYGVQQGSQQIASALAGAEEVGRVHRVVGAGGAGAVAGMTRSALSGGDPEDILQAAGWRAGFAAAAELVASEKGADGARETDAEFIAELNENIESAVQDPNLQAAAAGRVVRRIGEWCKDNPKKCNDMAKRVADGVTDGVLYGLQMPLPTFSPTPVSPGSSDGYGIPSEVTDGFSIDEFLSNQY